MLYDKRWDEPKVKADPFSLESLIAWLEKQPGATEYCYSDTGHCLLAQYFEAAGFEQALLGSETISWGNADIEVKLPLHFNEIAQGSGGIRTFGAALERARKTLGPQDSAS